MKKYFIFILFLFSCVTFSLAQKDDWQTKKSTHFIVYYKNAPEDFLNKLIEKSEGYYNRIAEDLGFIRFNFWLWDDRAKVYIYDDALSYQRSTGQPSWAGGSAVASNKTISTFINAPGFFNIILPHEMGHIIFREFVGFDNRAVPLWLEEGVASYQEKAKYASANNLLKNVLAKGNFIAIEKLFALDSLSGLNNESVQLFYLESFSIVNFLIKQFGKDRFVLFCRDLRDKKNLDRAAAANYPYNNIEELGKAWQGRISNG